MKTLKTAAKRAFAMLLALSMLLSMGVFAHAEDTGTYDQESARATLKMANEYRTGPEAWYRNEDNTTITVWTGLHPLIYDDTLESIAMTRAAELVQKNDHIRPDGSICFSLFEGKGFDSMGENIATGYPTAETVMGVEPINTTSGLNYGWMETNEDYVYQGHRRNILDHGFTRMGVAHFIKDGEHYWVQEFGSKSGDITSGTSTTQADDKPKKSDSTEQDDTPKQDTPKQDTPKQTTPSKTTYTPSFKNITLTQNSKKQTRQLKFNKKYGLKFKSSDKKNVSVSASGKITVAANFAGRATITVTGGNKSYSVRKKTFTLTVNPSKPSLSKLTVKKRKVTAQWKRNKAATGYEVQYATSKNFKKGLQKNSIKTNRTVKATSKALKKGSTCYVRVRSYKTSGKKKLYSAWSAVRSIKVK